MDLYGNNIYLNVSNKDSLTYFPNNKESVFRVKLAQPLNLTGCWKLALCEIELSGVKITAAVKSTTGAAASGSDKRIKREAKHQESIRVQCDLCKGFIVDGFQTRTMRTLPLKRNQYKIFPTLYYLSLETHYIDTIEFLILTRDGKQLSFDREGARVEMTLRLKRS